MKCWRAPDSRLVVETDDVWDLTRDVETLHTPEGDRIERAHTYYIARAGEVEEVLEPTRASDQECLYTSGFVCTPADGGWRLRKVGCVDTDSRHSCLGGSSREVVLDRLQPLPPQECPSAERLARSAEALRSRRRREFYEAERQREKELGWLESADELPDVPGNQPLDLVWDTEPVPEDSKAAMTVIRTSEGTVVWSERANFGGEQRFAVVQQILREKYGNRLRSFQPNLKNWNCLWYWTTD